MASIKIDFAKWIEEDFVENMFDEEDDVEYYSNPGFYSSNDVYGHIDYGWGFTVTEDKKSHWIGHITGSFEVAEDGSVKFELYHPEDEDIVYGSGTAESVEQMIELIKTELKSNELTAEFAEDLTIEADEESGEIWFDCWCE